MNTTTVGIAFHFQCPVHGSEFHAFCPESLRPKNRDGWTKFNVIYLKTEIEDEELDRFIEKIRTSTIIAEMPRFDFKVIN